ncbi:MAG: Holliday junction branch migration protein RuvA, partial [Rhodoglobus sp.]
EDDGAFRKVSGIGPKTAKLIVVSLAGKLIVAPGVRAVGTPRASSVGESVTVALIGLGWPERVALQAVEEALAGASDSERGAVPAILRLALAHLGPQAVNSQ